ncbi:hypothetical protein H1R20_g16298, partial [Candolleomyces eurysporus]
MSFATLQTVEELLPFAANVERKALPEVIGFLNHCLSVAPQWTAKDTDLVRARQLLLGSTMAIAARGAIDTAKGLCPRIEAWVNILAKHDNWISDPNAPLDLAVFKQEEPPPHLPNKALEPRGQMETETAGDVDSLEQRKQEGKGKGQSTASGDEPMNLDLPEHEELGGKKRRTPIVSDDEMEPLEEVATKRQKTDLKTFRRIGGAPGLERDQEEGGSGEATKLAKVKARASVKKPQPQKLETLKRYDPKCEVCIRRNTECSTWYENQACSECTKSKLRCRYAKGGAVEGEDGEVAEESKPKPKTKLPAQKSENQSTKGQAGPSKPPAKRPPKADKGLSSTANASSDSYQESETEGVPEKRPKAVKVRGKGQVKKQTSGDVNQKAQGKQSGSGQPSVAKGSGRVVKSAGGNEWRTSQRVDPANYREVLTGNMEEAVAKFFERAISHEMMQAELRGELTGVRRELEGMVSEVSDLFDQDELTHEAIEKLQQDFEALDS